MFSKHYFFYFYFIYDYFVYDYVTLEGLVLMEVRKGHLIPGTGAIVVVSCQVGTVNQTHFSMSSYFLNHKAIPPAPTSMFVTNK